MPRSSRQMRLTADHVRRVHRDIADPGPQLQGGTHMASDAEYAAEVARMLATRPPGPLWLFGYGSLIWKPATAIVAQRVALAKGWHRRFCLGPDRRWRGNPDRPGLMLALDRGGQCRGVAYQLPEDGLEAELGKLIRREMTLMPPAFPWRWIDVITAEGPLRAMTFAMNRNSARYVAGLSPEALADILATAVGINGSMAEYLFSTVAKLEELGIHDRNLWRLQSMVADRIDAAHPTEL